VQDEFLPAGLPFVENLTANRLAGNENKIAVYTQIRQIQRTQFVPVFETVATTFFDSTGPVNGENKTKSNSGNRFR
jgi:hypothetical protein